MTKKERKDVDLMLGILESGGSLKIYERQRKNIAAYRAEFERMRQFIKNLADETAVFVRGDG